MKKLILFIVAIATLTSCYEYRKLPNTKRPTKREVKKAMNYSTWEYNNHQRSVYHNSVYRYQK